jgi:DNA repair protein RadD
MTRLAHGAVMIDVIPPGPCAFDYSTFDKKLANDAHADAQRVLRGEVRKGAVMNCARMLRDYQERCIAELRHSYATGHHAPILVLPTGCGKTKIFVEIAGSAARKGRRVLIVVHRRELLNQAVAKLADAGVSCGIIAAGVKPDPAHLVQVASIQTIVRRLDTLPAFDLIVFDECHHAVAGQWRKLMNAQPKAKLLGVTATPARLDGKGLGDEDGGPFDDMIHGPDVAELVADGFLTPARCYVPAQHPNLRGVRARGGDYVPGDLEDAVAAANLTGNAIEQYHRRADHLPAIAFCISVKHAETVASAFRNAGYRSRMICGATPKAQRDAAIAGLATGEVEVLTSCDLISEGLDVPAVGAVILLRPTKSLVLHKQQVGRGMRPAPGKDALIVLDHAANTLTHGLPETPQKWSLAGVKREPGMAPPDDWECPKCGCLNPSCSLACVGCEFEREVEAPERELVGNGEGDLTELTSEILSRIRAMPYRQFVSEPRSEEELRIYAQHRGYKKGWIFHLLHEQRGHETISATLELAAERALPHRAG